MLSRSLPNDLTPGLLPLGDASLTVACVYRSGGRSYSPRYVDILYAMVERNLTLPHRFVCLTDVSDVSCERIPLVTGWPKYFAKIELFRPGLFRGPVLYFDLDTVIHRNIDDIGRMAANIAFGCVSDPSGGYMNSSVLTFSVDCSFIYEAFKRTSFYDRHVHQHVWFTLRRVGLERLVNVGSSWGDQGFAEQCLVERGVPLTYVDHLLPGMFANYGDLPDRRQRPDGGVCMMMGRPKPHQVSDGWVASCWA